MDKKSTVILIAKNRKILMKRPKKT